MGAIRRTGVDIDKPAVDGAFRAWLKAIARKAMKIAADICIYTNQNIAIEKL